MQICAALTVTHKAGVIHGDLKPSNIFLVQEGGMSDRVKILDYGVAQFTGPRKITGPQIPLKARGGGTPAYMSPEQSAGSTVDARSDVYALGVLLGEAATGTRPDGGVPASGVAEFDQLVEACTAQKRDRRPVSASIVAQRLRQLLVLV